MTVPDERRWCYLALSRTGATGRSRKKACGSGSDVQLRSLAIPGNSLQGCSVRSQDVAAAGGGYRADSILGRVRQEPNSDAGSGRQLRKQGREGEVNARDCVIRDGFRSVYSGMIRIALIQG